MLRYANVILLAFTTTVQAQDLLYSRIAESLSHEPCMSNCVDGRCFTYIDKSQTTACRDTGIPSPVYYTSQAMDPSREYCLGACGRFGSPYEWCATDSNGSWDYCSSQVRDKDSIVRRPHFTTRSGVCKDFCRETSQGYWCTNYWGYQDTCDPKPAHDYMQAYNRYGKKCAGTCTHNEGKSYFWCYDEGKYGDYCAPPARARFVYNVSHRGRYTFT